MNITGWPVFLKRLLSFGLSGKVDHDHGADDAPGLVLSVYFLESHGV